MAPKIPDTAPLVRNIKELESCRTREDDRSVRHLLGIRLTELKHMLGQQNFDQKVEWLQNKGYSEKRFSYSKRTVRFIKDMAGNLCAEERRILTAVEDFYRTCYSDSGSDALEWSGVEWSGVSHYSRKNMII